MCKIIGFIMFWIAIGIIIGLWIESTFLAIILIILLMVLGYNLFCGKC